MMISQCKITEKILWQSLDDEIQLTMHRGQLKEKYIKKLGMKAMQELLIFFFLNRGIRHQKASCKMTELKHTTSKV